MKGEHKNKCNRQRVKVEFYEYKYKLVMRKDFATTLFCVINVGEKFMRIEI